MTLRIMHYVLGLNAIFIHVLALSQSARQKYNRLNDEHPCRLKIQERSST